MYNGQERRKLKRVEKKYMTRFKIRSYEAQDKEMLNATIKELLEYKISHF